MSPDFTLFSEGPITNAINGAVSSAGKDSWNQAANQARRDSSPTNPNGLGTASLSNSLTKASNTATDILNNTRSGIAQKAVDNRSIIARSRDSICYFPMYISQSIRANVAEVIARSFERMYTTLVQTVLSQHPIITEDEANNLGFLQKIHTNIAESASEASKAMLNEYYKPIDDLDAMMQESVFYSAKLSDNCMVEFTMVPCNDPLLMQEHARLIQEPLAGFFYLKEDNIPRSYTRDETQMDNVSNKDVENLIDTLANSNGNTKKIATALKIDQNTTVKEMEDLFIKNPQALKPVTNLRYDGFKWYRVVPKMSQKEAPIIDAPHILREADIRRINSMTPLTIEVAFRIKGNDASGLANGTVKYVVGVKSTLHLIDIQDLSDDLRELIVGNIKALQNVRYKTGEITWAQKVLNIDGIKKDLSRAVNPSKRWINTLKRLSEYRKMNGAMLDGLVRAVNNEKSAPIPNGTMVLSQPDVSQITNATGIDLTDINNARRLCQSLFLIAFAIIDATDGTIRILRDMEPEWDIQSLAAMDAEVAKMDNSPLLNELQKVVNR